MSEHSQNDAGMQPQFRLPCLDELPPPGFGEELAEARRKYEEASAKYNELVVDRLNRIAGPSGLDLAEECAKRTKNLKIAAACYIVGASADLVDIVVNERPRQREIEKLQAEIPQMRREYDSYKRRRDEYREGFRECVRLYAGKLFSDRPGEDED